MLIIFLFLLVSLEEALAGAERLGGMNTITTNNADRNCGLYCRNEGGRETQQGCNIPEKVYKQCPILHQRLWKLRMRKKSVILSCCEKAQGCFVPKEDNSKSSFLCWPRGWPHTWQRTDTLTPLSTKVGFQASLDIWNAREFSVRWSARPQSAKAAWPLFDWIWPMPMDQSPTPSSMQHWTITSSLSASREWSSVTFSESSCDSKQPPFYNTVAIPGKLWLAAQSIPPSSSSWV